MYGCPQHSPKNGLKKMLYFGVDDTFRNSEPPRTGFKVRNVDSVCKMTKGVEKPKNHWSGGCGSVDPETAAELEDR